MMMSPRDLAPPSFALGADNATLDEDAGREALRKGDIDLVLLDLVMPGRDGLLHVSQIANERVNNVSDYLKEGQVVKVKVLETDEKGRIRLSMKALLAENAS